MKNIRFTLSPEDNDRLNNLCGALDDNLIRIEKHLAIEISHRGHDFQIIGPDTAVDQAQHFLHEQYQKAQNPISPKSLTMELQAIANEGAENRQLSEEELHKYTLHTPKRTVKPKGQNQRRYIKRMQNNDVNFGIGPAGTGKTYLAVAQAVAAFETGKVKRIILVRPAVEAGENLGFLPGDLLQKVDPYLRPMYDALYEFLGVEKVMQLIERNTIEVAPLAFMRGRTLNDAYVILDEAQNTTKEQMKMFLTRIGFNSRAIITGDITQIDLPHNKLSGLRHVLNILTDVPGVAFTFLDTHDVVRHALVQKIVAAYEKYEHDHP